MIRHAEDAAARAKKSAAEAEQHRKEADQIYLDAKLLYAKTTAAEDRMQELLKKIPPKKLLVKCAPVVKKEEPLLDAPKAEPAKPIYPQYSPSDAPAGMAPPPTSATLPSSQLPSLFAPPTDSAPTPAADAPKH